MYVFIGGTVRNIKYFEKNVFVPYGPNFWELYMITHNAPKNWIHIALIFRRYTYPNCNTNYTLFPFYNPFSQCSHSPILTSSNKQSRLIYMFLFSKRL